MLHFVLRHMIISAKNTERCAAAAFHRNIFGDVLPRNSPFFFVELNAVGNR